MSFEFTKACRPLQLPPTQKATLMALADFCHDDGRDWHSLASLMEWTCLGKTTVIDALKALEGRRLIRIDRRLGAKNVTFLDLESIRSSAQNQCASRTGSDGPMGQDHEDNRCGSRTGAGGGPVRVADKTGAGGVRTGAAPVQTGAGGAPEALEASEASMKHQEARTRAKGFDASSIELPPWLPRDAWEAWAADRRERGKPITKRAAELQVKQLDRLRADGVQPRAVIEHSIEKGYQGLFPPKSLAPASSPHGGTSRRVLHADDVFEGAR